MNWSRKYDSCISCNTTLYQHRSKGLCDKCKRVDKEIEELENADNEELDEFLVKYIPAPKRQDTRRKDFQVQKEIIKKHIEASKLLYLRQYGEIESGSINVDILILETILNKIAHHVTKKESFYTNKLMRFKSHFNEEQRKIIALKLLRMLIKK